VISRVLAAAMLLLAAGAAAGTVLAQGDDRVTCERASGEVAIAACNRAIASGRFSGVALAKLHTNRGVELKQKGDLDAALKDYDAAIALNPVDFFAFNNRANVRRDKGDVAGAIADYSEAARLEPDYAAAYLNRGLLQERIGDLAQARVSFNAVLATAAAKFRNSPAAHEMARERLRALAQ
jgi:tetratricopeptide (TPR) repeat protein